MTENEIRNIVIKNIKQQYKDRFRVFDNTGDDKKVIAGQFPDVLFMQKEPPPNTNILFVLKVETGENLLDKIAEWKALGSTPSVLYIVIPKDKLDDAKKIASLTGVRTRFAWYELDEDKIKEIRYE